MATVLVVDRDALDRELISSLLAHAGHRVLDAPDGRAAADMLAMHAVDLVAVETSGPSADWLRTCQMLRQLDAWVPMIIVSDHADIDHVVLGLTSAADDYLRKPFYPQELLARINALLRRASLRRVGWSRDDSIVLGEITLDQQRMCAHVNKVRVPLTPRELALLRTFMENPDRVLTRDQLLELAWGDGFVVTSKAVDVYVLRLRRKLHPHLLGDFYIHSLRGFGYMFTPAQMVTAVSTAELQQTNRAIGA